MICKAYTLIYAEDGEAAKGKGGAAVQRRRGQWPKLSKGNAKWGSHAVIPRGSTKHPLIVRAIAPELPAAPPFPFAAGGNSDFSASPNCPDV